MNKKIYIIIIALIVLIISSVSCKNSDITKSVTSDTMESDTQSAYSYAVPQIEEDADDEPEETQLTEIEVIFEESSQAIVTEITDEEYMKISSAYRDAWVAILEMLAEEKYYSGSICADASYNNQNHYYFLRDSKAIIEFANILKELQLLPKVTAQCDMRISMSHIYVDSFFFYTGELFMLAAPGTGEFVCPSDTYTKTENLMESIPEDNTPVDGTQPLPNTWKPKQIEISYSSWLPIETDDEYLKKLTSYRDAWVTVMETVVERRYYPESGNISKSYIIERDMEYILQDRESMTELIEIVKQAEPMDTSVLHGATGIRIADIRFDYMNIHIDRYGDYILFDLGYTGILGLVYNGDESDINDFLQNAVK